MTTTDWFLLLILIVAVFGVRAVSSRLEEAVDAIKEVKDLSEIILGSLERIESGLRGHE